MVLLGSWVLVWPKNTKNTNFALHIWEDQLGRMEDHTAPKYMNQVPRGPQNREQATFHVMFRGRSTAAQRTFVGDCNNTTSSKFKVGVVAQGFLRETQRAKGERAGVCACAGAGEVPSGVKRLAYT